jgi:hypothetical protein
MVDRLFIVRGVEFPDCLEDLPRNAERWGMGGEGDRIGGTNLFSSWSGESSACGGRFSRRRRRHRRPSLHRRAHRRWRAAGPGTLPIWRGVQLPWRCGMRRRWYDGDGRRWRGGKRGREGGRWCGTFLVGEGEREVRTLDLRHMTTALIADTRTWIGTGYNIYTKTRV